MHIKKLSHLTFTGTLFSVVPSLALCFIFRLQSVLVEHSSKALTKFAKALVTPSQSCWSLITPSGASRIISFPPT